MATEHLWEEIALCREAYGFFQTLSVRPLSAGNDIARKNARDALSAIVTRLTGMDRRLLQDAPLDMTRMFLRLSDTVPLETVARTLVGAFGDLLAEALPADETPLAFYASPGEGSPAIHRVVVLVGPTIGIGDEVLLARAILDRCREAEIPLHVCSRCFDVWSMDYGGGVTAEHAGDPPLGAFQQLDALSVEERAHTFFVYLDFSCSDAMQTTYCGPPGVLGAARWIMGAATGDVVMFNRDGEGSMRYALRYPPGLPAARALESKWAALRLLPLGSLPNAEPKGAPLANRATCRRDIVPRLGTVERPCRLALQLLTSKPNLMLPPALYREVFQQLSHRVGAIEVHPIPGPTEPSAEIVDGYAEVLSEVVDGRVVRYPAMSLSGVWDLLASADVLFGPDTFTSHFAAALGLPQVTLMLPEHRAWAATGAPAVIVDALEASPRLATTCVSRLAAFLRLRDPEWARELTDENRTFVRRLARVRQHVVRALRGGAFDLAEVAEDVVAVQTTYPACCETAGRLCGVRFLDVDPPFRRYRPGRFSHPEDEMAALARFADQVSRTEVAGLLWAVGT